MKPHLKNWGLETYSPEVGSELARIIHMLSYYGGPFELLPLYKSFRNAGAYLQSHNVVNPHEYTYVEFWTDDWSKIQEAALQFAIHANIELYQQSQEDYYRGIDHDDKAD